MYRTLFFAFAVLVFGWSSCSFGGSSSNDKEQSAEAAADNTTGGEDNSLTGAINQLKEATEKMNNGETKEAVDFRELKALLPDKIAGLERKNSQGEKTGFAGFKVSQAEADYEDGDKRAEVKIVDVAGFGAAMMGMAAWISLDVDKENDGGYERTTKINGYKAYEKYDNSNQSGELAVIVADRFIVTIHGNGVSMDDLKDALNDIDLDDLAELK